ncbi:MAG: hypothetical protein KKF41_00360 [Actinobacteria bacterium]|nr:hypothetical protein [Actinomycetota bacterium]MBU1942698.1 hypothetical protein [Actinomycetota bacterium]MBU2686020.1 hypothetical protein [Actinomycetota bacterium]
MLDELLEGLRRHPGLTRKAVVGLWASRFFSKEEWTAGGVGADAGAVPVPGGYLLVSAEGIFPELLADPGFAGLCAVTVAVNDIYAVGGRPLGIVAVVFAGDIDADDRERFLDGFEDGLAHYGIQMLGGHTSPEAGLPSISVAAVGYATALIRGPSPRPGDRLLLVCDLEGTAHLDLFAWDAVTGHPPERTRTMLEVLPRLAEEGVRVVCRDISNPGILGTCAMMLEPFAAGARVDLDAVPVPPGVTLDWWLAAHPSFGFILAAPPEVATCAREAFAAAGASCTEVGETTPGTMITVTLGDERADFMDVAGWPVTGLGRGR